MRADGLPTRIGLFAAGWLLALGPAWAASVTVTNTADESDGTTTSIAALQAHPGADGKISLREAIAASNNTPGANTIALPAGTFTLTLGLLAIGNSVTITGPGAGSTLLDGNGSLILKIQNSAAVTLSGMTLRNGNNPSGNGGAISSPGSGLLTLAGVTFSGNSAGNGAGGAVYAAGAVAITGCTFGGNSSSSGGGALWVSNSGASSITGTTFSGNQSSNGSGGAIYFSGSSGGDGGGGSGTGTLTLSGDLAVNNSASNSGGAMYIQAAGLSDNFSSFSSNTSINGSGGAVYISTSGTATLTGTTFSGNTAPAGSGGAIAFGSGGGDGGGGNGTLSLSGISAQNNSASQNGGAVSAQGAGFSDAGGSYSSNLSSSGSGGAVYISTSGSASLTGTSLSGNTASNGSGGAISFGSGGGDGGGGNGPMTLSGVSAQNNTASQNGGAISMQGAAFSDSGGSYSSNVSSNGSGGALYLSVSASATLTTTTISGNHANNNGAGISFGSGGGGDGGSNSAALQVINSTIGGNQSANGSGAGLSVSQGTATITSSTVSANSTVNGYGGAVYLGQYAGLALTNDTLSGNAAARGGGLFLQSGTVALMNITLASNSASSGSAIYAQSGHTSGVTITNTIVANNTGGSNCSTTVANGGHNLDSGTSCGFRNGSLNSANALLAALADNGGPTQTMALLTGSPAIAAGTPTGAPATDQRGVSRANPPCIGAYEGNGSGGGGGGGGGGSAAGLNAVDGYYTSYPAATSSQRIFMKLAGTPFSLYIAALNSSGALASPAYVSGTNQVTVDLVDDSDGSCASACSGSACQGKSPVATRTTSFAGSDASYKSLPFTVANAFPDLRVRIRDATNTPAVTGCSVDNFSVRPLSLAVTSSANADPSGASISAGPTVKAGATFTLTATALAGYSGTPSVASGAWIANPPFVGALSGSFGGADPGTGAASGSFTYAEAGYFSMNAHAVNDTAFTTVDQAGGDCTADYSNTPVNGQYGCYFGNASATAYFGRFIPDHFAVAAGSVTPACGTFTYYDQDGFVTTFTLTAQSASNTTTQNYTGAFAKLGLTSWAGYGFSGDSATPAASATAPAGTWSNGVASISAKHQVLARPTSTPAAPVSLTVSARPVDADGVTTSAPLAVMSAATSLRFGVLALGSAYGSDLLPLRLPVTAMVWNGTGLVANAADVCTGAALSNASIALGNQVQKPGTRGSFATALQATPTLASSWSQGTGSIWLAAPGIAGAAQVALNLGSGSTDDSCIGWSVASTGSGLPWLRGRWCGTNYSVDPSSLASFGTAATPFVFLRENYQ